MERVLAQADEAKTIFLTANASATATSSKQAYETRQHFSKAHFKSCEPRASGTAVA
jgi:hypothetical protein